MDEKRDGLRYHDCKNSQGEGHSPNDVMTPRPLGKTDSESGDKETRCKKNRMIHERLMSSR